MQGAVKEKEEEKRQAMKQEADPQQLLNAGIRSWMAQLPELRD